MEKIALVVDQLNLAPFNKGYSSLAEYDSHSGFELLEILCEILIAISPDQTPILKENIELKVQRIIQFLEIMKYDMSDDGLLQKLTSISKDTINKIILYCFENFDTLKKRAYLAKFLLPVTVPSDFISDDLVYELLQNLKELQVQFKDIHKEADQLDNIGDKTNHLKVEITQLEQEKNQLQNKIQRMKRDSQEDEIYFRDMLRATTVLRSAQEDEAAIYQRLSEHRQVLRDTEIKLTDSSQRLNSIKSDGIQKLSADQLVSKMQCDVKILYDRREALTATLSDRTQHLEKIGSWSVSSDRTGTYEDVQVKREQIRALQDDIKQAQARLDACDNASKLAVFRQAATMAEKKLREREDEVNKLIHERKRVLQLVQDKESALTNFIDAHSSSTAGHDNNSLRIDVAKKSALCKEQHNELGGLFINI